MFKQKTDSKHIPSEKFPIPLSIDTSFQGREDLRDSNAVPFQEDMERLAISFNNCYRTPVANREGEASSDLTQLGTQFSQLSILAQGQQLLPSIPPHGQNQCHTSFAGNPYSPIPITPGVCNEFSLLGSPQKDYPPQCVSADCPLGGRSFPHNEGLYLHENKMAESTSRHPVWGWSNPPPEIRAAYLREKERERVLGNDRIFPQDVRYADFCRSQSFEDHMIVHMFKLHRACHIVTPHQLEVYMMGEPKLDQQETRM